MRLNRANTCGDRSNALWGRGSRGESRSNALWGRGGRRAGALVASLTVVFAMAAGATAAGLSTQASSSGAALKAYVPVSLGDAITQTPDQTFDVIVQGDKKGTSNGLYKQLLGDLDTTSTAASVRQQFNSINGLQANLTGKQIATLANKSFVTSIVPNETVEAQGYSNNQGWTTAVNVWPNWQSPVANAPTIAVVDSGIQANRSDFGSGYLGNSRVLAQVNLTSIGPNSSGDGYGHGTFVAGIAGGS